MEFEHVHLQLEGLGIALASLPLIEKELLRLCE
jgi:hypothetical protein